MLRYLPLSQNFPLRLLLLVVLVTAMPMSADAGTMVSERGKSYLVDGTPHSEKATVDVDSGGEPQGVLTMHRLGRTVSPRPQGVRPAIRFVAPALVLQATRAPPFK